MKNAEGSKKNKQVATPSFFGRYLPELIVFCFAFLLYANSISNNYNLDDELVTRNHKLTSRGISAMPEIFSSPYYTDEAGYSYEYRPVVLSSFAIEHQFFGDNPHISHFFNLLLYALCCVLLYRTLYHVIPGQAQLLSLCITLLFVANPTHTEAVCSIKNRDEILSLLFGLLAVYWACLAIAKNKPWLLFLVPVSFLAALLCKTTIVSFVIIIPLTLIFFTEISFKHLLLLGFLLLVPAVYAVDMSFWHKLTGSVFFFAFLSVFYIGSHYNKAVISARLKAVKLWLTAQHNHLNRLNPLPTVRGIKEVFTGINPGPEIFKFKPAAIALATGGLYFLGVCIVFNPLVVASVIIFGFLIIRGEEPVWWWASIVFFICLAFAPIKYAWNHTLYSQLVSTILIYYLLFGNRKLFVPVAAIYLVYAVASFYFDVFQIVPNRLIGMAAMRVVGWPAIIWQFIMLHNILKHIKWNDLSTVYQELNGIGFASLLITPLMLSIIFKKGAGFMIGAITIVAVGVMLFDQGQNNPLGVVALQNKLSGAANKITPRFIDVKQQRPLDYAEQPVTNQDALTIRLGTAFEVMGHYFAKTIWPWQMAYYYGFRFIKPEPITDPVPLFALLIYLAIAVLSIVLIPKNKLLSAGIIIYLSSLTVFSGYFYPVPGLVAERFMLIPTLGWSIILGAALFFLFKLNSKLSLQQGLSVSAIPKAVFLLILVFYSVRTFSRNFDWKDDLTLFRHDIAYVNESAQANNLLAIHLMHRSLDVTDAAEQKAMREEALVHLKKTVEIVPDFFNANYDLGRMYMVLNMPDSALVWFIKANKIKPSFIEADFDIANIYLAANQYQPAIPYLEHAIKNRPTDYRGYSNLSYIYFQQHDLYKSIEINRQAIAQISPNASPYVNIGNVYLALNKPDSAALWAHKALEIEPANKTAAQILQQAGNRR